MDGWVSVVDAWGAAVVVGGGLMVVKFWESKLCTIE